MNSRDDWGQVNENGERFLKLCYDIDYINGNGNGTIHLCYMYMSHFAYLYFVSVKAVSGTYTEHYYLQELQAWQSSPFQERMI